MPLSAQQRVLVDRWLPGAAVERHLPAGRRVAAMTDLARLAALEFRGDPALEAAFLDGYGSDPREPRAWHRIRVREAISTAGWAYRVGDEAFENQDHRMIAEALDASA